MLELLNIKLPLTADEAQMRAAAAKKLRLSQDKLERVFYLKRAVDARKKENIFYLCTLGVSLRIPERQLRLHDPDVRPYTEPKICFPADVGLHPALRPVVCGAGPAGLFAALTLAKAGLKPILVERGAPAETRTQKIDRFFQTGELDRQTNVQFGEGGAGMFSDGKLTTNIHDERCYTVLKTFCDCGAPDEILYQAKPHLGTDQLEKIVRVLRDNILQNGGEVRFFTTLTDLRFENGSLAACVLQHGDKQEILPCDRLILATGHSATDVFTMLKRQGVPMQRKPFSIGVRIEHEQGFINQSQYGTFAHLLPPADYKLSCHLQNGRGVYTFCMCPGGFVVAAASEENELVVNGMSRFARNGENANAALLCDVRPEDFEGDDVLAGVAFQKKFERLAFEKGGGSFRAPAQLCGDFCAGRPSEGGGRIKPTYPLGVTWGDLAECLPPFAVEALREAIPLFDRKLKGFADPEAVLTGVETRSSSPVRINRNKNYQSTMQGLYPCGEGAGYAGGIMSAAVDGIRVAEAVIHDLQNIAKEM